jgi:hypothetical protein
MFRTEIFGASISGHLVWYDVACDPKSCVAVCIVSVLFVLFLLVMYIWVDLQVKILDLHLNLGQAKPSQAKLTAWEACKGIPSQHQPWKRMFDQSTMGVRPIWTSPQQHH